MLVYMVKDKKKILILGVLIIATIVALIGATYAFFSAGVTGEQEKLSLSTGTMALTFADNDNGINEQLHFGQSVTKKFKIINTGTLEASMSLDWVNLVNTYTNGSLSYTLSKCTENCDGADATYTEELPKTDMPVSSTELTQTLAGEISVPAHTTYYYNLTITLNDLPTVDQTADATAEFRTMFKAGDPARYRYYTLTVDPNGGTWGEFTAPQTYQLKNNETMNITDVPTKVGATFSGWKLTGVSAEYSDKVFTMGISDATLVALWDLQKIQVTVNGTPQEVDYGSTVDLGIPPEKEGYTFTGWSATGGIVSGNTLKVTDVNNITVTPTYIINKYKYIVYHNKQNVDGNGYTLVGADTDEDEAEYNTKVTPNTKTYTGFTSPAQKELTIKAETTYPPVLNKVDYNYNRNKYTLTINPNGGTYNSTTENTVVNDIYYEATYPLGTPTKTGYEFANWSNNGVTLADNTFTMGDADATVVANYTASTYSVTFNANGGAVTTASKTVTYDGTYGDLPEPTYAGYIFDGWYTTQTGKVQVTSTTKVTIPNNHTLYAHWLKLGANATLTKLGVTAKTGKPTFSSAATTNEGVYSMADDYGTSYYYRGAVTNNYVKFGKWAAGTKLADGRDASGKDMWWRIIRVNGDGSIRMLYDGTTAHRNGEGNKTFEDTGVDSTTDASDRFTHIQTAFNSNKGDNAYVGWMYGTPGRTKTLAQTNTNNSPLKGLINTWYDDNLATSYDQYIADAVYCNDRNTPGQSVTGWSDDTGLGYGTQATGYGAMGRLVDISNSVPKPNATPQFLCSRSGDSFTVSDSTHGNAIGTTKSRKVGLITADEVAAAGGAYFVENRNYYLYKSSVYFYWSLSPAIMGVDGEARVFYVGTGGYLGWYIVSNQGGVAPVISIKAEYAAKITGSGTADDPYTIPGVA